MSNKQQQTWENPQHGFLDLDEASENSCPTEEQKSLSTLWTVLTALQTASRKATAFSCSQVSTSQHRCWRLRSMPWNRLRALAQMLSSGFWTSRKAVTEGLWILRRTSCRAS